MKGLPTAAPSFPFKMIIIIGNGIVYFLEVPNEAERALRHAVIARRISYGTRTPEGSLAYCSVLSVIETCRLRKVNPWGYIAMVLTQARKGIKHPPIPVAS